MSTSISIPTRPLSTKAGIEVSEICLGGATWRVESAGEPRMPASTPDASQAILNRYFDAGGNFIDVADVYQNGESERAVGQWLQRRQSGDATFRSRVVVATKYGLRVGPGPNQRGASRSHILRQVEQSLRRLQTDYIDLYVQHCWDRSTPIEETLHALNDLIRSGRVRYIGASNFSAWQLQKAATYAKAHGLTPFVSVQSQYNLLTRNLEWDVMDVCRAEGVAIMPWSPLAGGWLTGKYTKEGEEHSKDTNSRVGWAGTQSWAGAWSADTHCNDLTWTTVDALRRIAQKHSVSMSAVAIRWLLHRPCVSSVVIGPRTVEQLEENLQAATLQLTPEEVKELSDASRVQTPYPASFTRSQNPSPEDD